MSDNSNSQPRDQPNYGQLHVSVFRHATGSKGSDGVWIPTEGHKFGGVPMGEPAKGDTDEGVSSEELGWKPYEEVSKK